MTGFILLDVVQKDYTVFSDKITLFLGKNYYLALDYYYFKNI